MNKIKILGFSLLLLGSLISCGKADEKKETVKTIKPIKHGEVIQAGNTNSQEYSGIVQSSKEAHLSFRVNGNISTLPITVGQRVRRGQLIARIDATDYRVQVEQSKSNFLSAETQIKSAESQLNNSQANYQRIEKLYENNSVSLSDFEQAKSAMETAEASYQAAKAQAAASGQAVKASSNQVAYSTLTAPFSGVITTIDIEENEFVNAGKSVAILSAETQPEVQVGVPEVVIGKVATGQKVKVHFSAFEDKNYTGKVSEVGYSSQGGSTYPVIIKIDNPSTTIRPGMAAYVEFDFGNNNSTNQAVQQVLFVPIAAVGENSNGNFVYVLKPSNNHYTAQQQAIEIGALADKGFEVKSGLKEGDLVATSGLQTLLSGMAVRLME